MVKYACNPSTQGPKARGWQIQSYPGIHSMSWLKLIISNPSCLTGTFQCQVNHVKEKIWQNYSQLVVVQAWWEAERLVMGFRESSQWGPLKWYLGYGKDKWLQSQKPRVDFPNKDMHESPCCLLILALWALCACGLGGIWRQLRRGKL